MSAQGGIFYFDGRPVPRATVDVLAKACCRYGVDTGLAKDCLPTPGVALVFRGLQVAPEDHADRQPIELANGQWLTWDGRLDNRSDLMMELGIRPSRTTPDSEVVGEACRRWGTDALSRLIGDWSLALWDPVRRSVALASDFMGVRPMFYAATDAYCIWCTVLDPLVEILDARSNLDDEYLLGRLVYSVLPGRTPYRGISVLLAGHSVTLSPDGDRRPRQFWHLPDERLRYRDVRDYQVCFRDVFRQAVASRLRTDRSVWMELSGGLDSSSVVCMAAQLAHEGTFPVQDLTTLSFQMPTAPECDETRFIDAVEAATGLRSVRLPFDHAEPVVAERAQFSQTGGSTLQAYQQMRENGARLLLTGRFGDTVTGNVAVDVTEILEALRTCRPLALVRSLHAWGLASRKTAWSLLRMAGAELLPRNLMIRRLSEQALSSVRKLSSTSGTYDWASVFSPASLDIVRSTQQQLVDWSRAEGRPWMSGFFVRNIAVCVQRRSLMSPPYATDVRYTHPFADQRLVELMAMIDWSVICAPGRPRALMRDALGELLPARVARRFSKGYAAPFSARRATVMAASLAKGFDRLEVIRRGYVDPRSLRALLDAAEAGATTASRVLLRVNAIESWLRLAQGLDNLLVTNQ